MVSRIKHFFNYYLANISLIFLERIVFKDFQNCIYHLYKHDNLKVYFKRNSVTDAINVIKYIQSIDDQLELCFDLGANLGAVTMALHKKTKTTGVVISVEPDPDIHDRLKENITLNGFNCFTLNNAITNRNEDRKLKIPANKNGHQTFYKLPYDESNLDIAYVNVKCITFNKMFDLFQLDKKSKIDMLKMDIEGAELEVLNSISELLISKQINRLVFEYNVPILKANNKDIMSLYHFWNKFDYRMFYLDKKGEPIPLKIKDINHKQVLDVLCLANN